MFKEQMTLNERNEFDVLACNMSIFLFLIIGISLLSLSVSIIMINAQATSGGGGSEREGNNGKDQNQQDITDKQMGICAVGAGGSCNGDHNFDGRHDRTGQCILSNGCGNSKDK